MTLKESIKEYYQDFKSILKFIANILARPSKCLVEVMVTQITMFRICINLFRDIINEDKNTFYNLLESLKKLNKEDTQDGTNSH